MEILSSSKKNRKKGILSNLDFEKAFDNIDWRFLIALSKARGFGNNRWISTILNSSKMALLLNEEPTRWIQTRKYLKQEDPSSPLLFALVTDILSHLLKLAASNNMIRGIDRQNTTRSILLLQYADDH